MLAAAWHTAISTPIPAPPQPYLSRQHCCPRIPHKPHHLSSLHHHFFSLKKIMYKPCFPFQQTQSIKVITRGCYSGHEGLHTGSASTGRHAFLRISQKSLLTSLRQVMRRLHYKKWSEMRCNKASVLWSFMSLKKTKFPVDSHKSLPTFSPYIFLWLHSFFFPYQHQD